MTIAKLPKTEHPIMISVVIIDVPAFSILDVISRMTKLLPTLERTITRIARTIYTVNATPAFDPITPFIMTSNAKNHTIPKITRRIAVIVGGNIFFMINPFCLFQNSDAFYRTNQDPPEMRRDRILCRDRLFVHGIECAENNLGQCRGKFVRTALQTYDDLKIFP